MYFDLERELSAVRAWFVVQQSLAIFIAWNRAIPSYLRQESNIEDAETMLLHLVGNLHAKQLISEAEDEIRKVEAVNSGLGEKIDMEG